MRRQALNRIGHRHQHPARAVPVRLRQQMPGELCDLPFPEAWSASLAFLDGELGGLADG
jgi:hypothetical protein